MNSKSPSTKALEVLVFCFSFVGAFFVRSLNFPKNHIALMILFLVLPVCTVMYAHFLHIQAATGVGRRCLLARLTCVRLIYKVKNWALNEIKNFFQICALTNRTNRLFFLFLIIYGLLPLFLQKALPFEVHFLFSAHPLSASWIIPVCLVPFYEEAFFRRFLFRVFESHILFPGKPSGSFLFKENPWKGLLLIYVSAVLFWAAHWPAEVWHLGLAAIPLQPLILGFSCASLRFFMPPGFGAAVLLHAVANATAHLWNPFMVFILS